MRCIDVRNIKMNNIDSAYFLFYYQPQGLGDAPKMRRFINFRI